MLTLIRHNAVLDLLKLYLFNYQILTISKIVKSKFTGYRIALLMTDIKDINIGIIHNNYLKKGGEDNVAESEFELLRANNYKVFSLTFSNPENKIKQLFIYLMGVFNIFSFFRCYRWLKANKIQLLHVHNWFFTASPAVFWAAKWCKIPVVATMHNYRMICPSGTLIFKNKPYLESLKKPFSWNAIKAGVYRNSPALTFNLAFIIWFNRLIGTWKLVKNFIVLTNHSKLVIKNSHLSSITPKLVTKPNFVPNLKLINPLPRNNNFLFVGRLSNEKGINLLLAAFKGSAHQLTIIGDGPLQPEIESFIRMNANVTYLGFKDKETIINELHTCSALLFPSIWYETFGLILIEAFASGTPVIASQCGSASIIIKDGYNGLHFKKANLKDLKGKIEEWIALDEDVKERFRENAYNTFQQYYTPEKNLKQLIKIYENAL